MNNARLFSSFGVSNKGVKPPIVEQVNPWPDVWEWPENLQSDEVIAGLPITDPTFYNWETQTTSEETVNMNRGQLYHPLEHSHCPQAVKDGWSTRVEITTEQNPNTVINANPQGTVFVLKAGVHQNRRITALRAGDILVGEYGSVLDGSGVSGVNAESCRAIYSEASVGAIVYNVKVENYPFYDNSTNVPPGEAIMVRGGRLINCEVNDCGNIGIKMEGPDTIVRWCVVRRCGRLNYSGGTWWANYPHTDLEGYRLEYCESVDAHVNNEFDAHWEAAHKWVRVTGMQARFNFFHGFRGYGLWFDGSVRDTLIEGNVCINGDNSGIHYEIGHTATIRHNTVTECGGPGGIFISNSLGCNIYNNTLMWNTSGLWVTDETSRSPAGKNNTFYNNRVYQQLVSTGSGQWPNGKAAVHYSPDSHEPSVTHNVWHDNKYYIDDNNNGNSLNSTELFMWLPANQSGDAGEMNFTSWSALAGESGSTIEYSKKWITIASNQQPNTIVQAAPAGSTFRFLKGLNRMTQTIAPKAGNVFLGQPGAILSGARLLTDWVYSAGKWYVTGQTQFINPEWYPGTCEVGYPRCLNAEDLFIDDVRIKHVDDINLVGPDTWFFDYAADRIYIGDNPTGRKVETSVTQFCFNSAVDNVTIKGLTIEKFANSAQRGAIYPALFGPYREGENWYVEGNKVTLNHGCGVTVMGGSTVRGNIISHNGQLGAGGSGDDIVFEYNEVAYNNEAGYEPGWEAGGTKFAYTNGLVIRGNHSHHNRGPGLWTDIDNYDVLYEDNLVEYNTSMGIFHEISFDAIIRNNVSRYNGLTDGLTSYAWGFGTGILIYNSSDVEVYGNLVYGNLNGIVGMAHNRDEWYLLNLNVHHNTIYSQFLDNRLNWDNNPGYQSKSGIVQADGQGYVFESGSNNVFDYNTHYANNVNASIFSWNNSDRNWTYWRSTGGHDANGTITAGTPPPPVNF